MDHIVAPFNKNVENGFLLIINKYLKKTANVTLTFF